MIVSYPSYPFVSMIYHPIILSIPPGYAREEQGLSRNFRMDPPASPARWLSYRLTSTDIPTPNYFKYLPTSKSPKPLYDSYWLISSFGYFRYGLISWMAVNRSMADLSFWIPTVWTIVVSQDPGCMQHADLRLATWDNLSNDKKPTKSTWYLANWPFFFSDWIVNRISLHTEDVCIKLADAAVDILWNNSECNSAVSEARWDFFLLRCLGVEDSFTTEQGSSRSPQGSYSYVLRRTCRCFEVVPLTSLCRLSIGQPWMPLWSELKRAAPFVPEGISTLSFPWHLLIIIIIIMLCYPFQGGCIPYYDVLCISG